ncbi:MAG TPA: hypothetical protein VFI14_10680 [Chryseosolibacter sp.]|nr:hypothetical protein [Chryseosolibacter sp.]
MNKYSVILTVSLLLTACGAKDAENVEVKQFLNGWTITKTTLDVHIDSRSMFFVNAEVGFVVGVNGGIYKTINSGKDWEKQNSRTTLHLYSVFFLNETTGFVSGGAMLNCLNDDCGKGSIMLKTTNGGETWSKMFFNDYVAIHTLHFFDDLNGLSIIEIPQVPNAGYLYVARTANGGNSWHLIDLPIMSYTNFRCIEGVTYVAGRNQKVYKSKDMGNTWETLDTPIPPWNDVGNLYFINQDIGFLNGVTHIYKTIDGGMNWEIVDCPFLFFSRLHFYDETEGFNIETVSKYEGGDFPTFKGSVSYQTNDGGINWTKSDLIDSFFLGTTCFPQRDLGYALNSSEFYTIKRR